MKICISRREMNQYVPDWIKGDNSSFKFPFSSMNQKKHTSPNNDLVELVWQNGNVVMNNQGHRKNDRSVQHCEQSLKYSNDLIQDDAVASWFQYPLDETLDKEFYSEFFSEMAGTDAICADILSKSAVPERAKAVKFDHSNDKNVDSLAVDPQPMINQENSMPSKSEVFGSSRLASCLQASGFSKHQNLTSSSSQYVEKGPLSGTKKGGQESSVMTVGSSICGSNQIQYRIDPSCNMSSDAAEVATVLGQQSDNVMRLISERARNNGYEATVTSSSGGSGFSIERTENQNASNQNHKRKAIVLEESGSHSEDAEYESNEGKKSSHQSKSVRRSRAAEVHNLAERRRRDRINEKMKALQDLIPHCNKTDKASMLDEAIEYLKSLQLQVQMMWTGSGMAPMIFPDVQQYMLGMGMGFGHNSLSSMHNAVQFPSAPFLNQPLVPASAMNQSFLRPPAVLNGVNFPNQMPNIKLPDSFGRLFNFQQMQRQSQIIQQNHARNNNIIPMAGGAPCHSLSNNKSGL